MTLEQLKAFVLTDIGAQRYRMSWQNESLMLWITPCKIVDVARVAGRKAANAAFEEIAEDGTVCFNLSVICAEHDVEPTEVMPF